MSTCRPQNPQPPVLGQAAPVDVCYFCEKKVYLVEKCAAEGVYFHRGCFRCYFCGTNLRLGAYTFQRGENDRGKLGFTSRVKIINACYLVGVSRRKDNLMII